MITGVSEQHQAAYIKMLSGLFSNMSKLSKHLTCTIVSGNVISSRENERCGSILAIMFHIHIQRFALGLSTPVRCNEPETTQHDIRKRNSYFRRTG